MNDRQIGAALRALRLRKGWRQADLACRAKVSRDLVGRIERGGSGSVSLGTVRRVADAMGAHLETFVRWRGGDMARLLSARHGAMHETMARLLDRYEGWRFEPEVSFSIYGERGVIDALGWHPATRALLVVELKTELVDINEMMAKLDRKTRLALVIARDRGWGVDAVSSWLALAEGRTNRRALAAHATVLRSKYPSDGRTIRAWLRRPSGAVRALSFLPEGGQVHARPAARPVRRVRGVHSGIPAPRASVADRRER